MKKLKGTKKISVNTLGCKVNQCDSAALEACLHRHGHTIVPSGATTDIHLVNTCVVTAKTEAQSRQLIRRALRSSPGCQVVVTGCYAQRDPAALAGISPRVHVLGNNEKADLPRYITEVLTKNGQVTAVSDIARVRSFNSPAYNMFSGRSRAFLKIQDGCDCACSFCIIPAVRGPNRSLPARDVLARFDMLTGSGYREIVLTGIHLGAYGQDLGPASTLLGLLENLETRALGAGVRLRLSSIEPREWSPELIRHVAHSAVICPHVHIPLQSGDDAVLRRMRRPYDTAFFRQLADALAAAIPNVNIGIDVIAGFPGETDEQFLNTLALLRRLPAGYFHVFPYSSRPGTPAARFSGQVSEPVKKQRVRLAQQLSHEKRHAFHASFHHTTLSCLIVDKRDKQSGRLTGISGNYIPIQCNASKNMAGTLQQVTITDVSAESVCGSVARQQPACPAEKRQR